MSTLLARRVSPASAATLLRRRDLEVLAWASEQYAVRMDQLEPLLGCRRTVQRTVARLRDQHLAVTRRLLVDEPAWVLPTAAGLRACGSSFRVWEPRLGLMAHVAAVNEVRLHVHARSPEADWICERRLARERAPSEHLPDAVVILDGQRVAIEVELTVKSPKRATQILDELSARFDSVIYFCGASPHRQLRELAASGRWPNLGVRELPSRE